MIAERRVTVIAHIDKMQRADVKRVMEIERKSFSTPWHESAYITELANPSAYYVVARIGDRLVGYCGMWVVMDEAHITTIAVEPENRRNRLGEQLLIAILEEAMRRGARRVTLEVRECNEVARRLYHKYGFVSATVRRGYYTDNGEDAIVMTVHDLLSPSYQTTFRLRKQLLFEAAEQEEHASGEPISKT